MHANDEIRSYSSQNLVVVHWTDTVDTANKAMRDRSIRHLPVVNDAGTIVGILSDRDVQRAMRPTSPPEVDPDALVIDFMSRPVVAIDRKATIKEAARRMIEKKISALIVTSGEFAIGVITTDDLLEAIMNEHDDFLSETKKKLTSVLIGSPVGRIVQSLADVGI